METRTTEVEGISIEIEVETGTYEGGWKPASSADAAIDLATASDDPLRDLRESAFTSARVLWDEAYTSTQGCRRRVTFRTFGPNAPAEGAVVRMERRP
jgi:hypothetical protein